MLADHNRGVRSVCDYRVGRMSLFTLARWCFGRRTVTEERVAPRARPANAVGAAAGAVDRQIGLDTKAAPMLTWWRSCASDGKRRLFVGMGRLIHEGLSQSKRSCGSVNQRFSF